MNIIFNCHVPFSLAHGGGQIQIEQTKAALESIGVSVEPLRWWDEQQSGDVLHHFGRIPVSLLRLARRKGIKVVMADLLTGQGSRTWSRLFFQRWITCGIERVFPNSMGGAFHWQSYRLADACVALTEWEAHLMNYLFRAPSERIQVVPNGVEQVFFDSAPAVRGEWLVCTATITERKRVLEAAEAAVAAKTPLWIIGKPYAESDPYAEQFLALARKHPRVIRFEGPVMDRAKMAAIYRAARGFILLSTMESLSLSALEAAACECPLLLSDLPWARTTFKENASYCPIAGTSRTAMCLRRFYDQAPALKPPPKPLTWIEVAQRLKTIYESLLNTSR